MARKNNKFAFKKTASKKLPLLPVVEYYFREITPKPVNEEEMVMLKENAMRLECIGFKGEDILYMLIDKLAEYRKDNPSEEVDKD